MVLGRARSEEKRSSDIDVAIEFERHDESNHRILAKHDGLNETTLGAPGTSGTYDDADRITVAMHEHGHFLGLGHSDYYAVMRDPYVDAISS